MGKKETNMLLGNVFDIQRYSIHDGPGIRTTVFLKGCSMRCKWCANPESWIAAPQLFFSKARCIKCGTCTSLEGITMGADGPVIERDRLYSDEELYQAAGACPTGALCVKGKKMTVSDVMLELQKDAAFYKRSKGGVTISGGEALLQAEFARELLKSCKEAGYHTVVETCGNVPWSHIEAVIPYTDMFFYDIKLADRNLHRQYTGSDNEVILENLKRLSGSGADICVRTPLIPGVNDNELQLDAIARVMKEANIKNYELLAFHQYGKGKYESCGIEYELGHLEQMSDERKEKLSAYIKTRM